MDLLDFILHPYTAWKYRKWKRQLAEKLRRIARQVNEEMLGRKIITQEEITAELKRKRKGTAKVLPTDGEGTAQKISEKVKTETMILNLALALSCTIAILFCIVAIFINEQR